MFNNCNFTNSPNTTKAINESIKDSSAPTIQSGGSQTDMSVAARMMMGNALKPAEAYQFSTVLQKAIQSVAVNVAKAKRRFFSRNTGEEFEGGEVIDLYNKPSPHMTGTNFIRDQAAWYRLFGELAIFKNVDLAGRLRSMKICNSPFLIPYPVGARSIDFVTHWQYNLAKHLDNDRIVMEIPAEQMAFVKNFNPFSDIRGLSPLIAGTQEVSLNYYANRYNMQRFLNNAYGDIVVRFSKNTSAEEAKKVVEEWAGQHNVMNNNGFRIIPLRGDEVQIEQLSQENKDGHWINMSQYDDEKIAALYGVPATIMGFRTARFDTVDAELESFGENTLMPLMGMLSEFNQHEIIDPHFIASTNMKKINGRVKTNPMTKAMKEAYTKAMDEYDGESDIIFILDPGSLPIMNRLAGAKLDAAKKYRETLDLSASEAASKVGIEIPDNPLRDDIWVPNNRVNISKATNAVKSLESKLDEMKKSITPEAPVEVNKTLLDSVQDWVRDYRNQVVKAVAEGTRFNKDEFLKSAPAPLVTQVHQDYLFVTSIKFLDKDARVKAIKDRFTELTRVSNLKELVTNYAMEKAIPAGATQERRILGSGGESGTHCPDCTNEAAMGWVAVGTLKPMHTTYCDGYCTCDIEYR